MSTFLWWHRCKMRQRNFIFVFLYLLGVVIFASADNKHNEVKQSLDSIKLALTAYEIHIGTFPSTEQGLKALVRRPITVNPELWKGPYLKSIPKDPWGEGFVYAFPGSHDNDYDLFSKGPDHTPDTADDIVNWDARRFPPGRTPPTPTPVHIPVALDPSKNYVETIGNLNIKMVWIAPVSFLYGSHIGRFGAPVVKLDGYWIGKFEVTTQQFCIFLNAVPEPEQRGYISIFSGSTYIKHDGKFIVRPGCEEKPAYPVSWMGADAFCDWLKAVTGKNYCLPTEAQWEKAARGGLKLSPYPWGEQSPTGRANYGRRGANDCDLLTPVGSYPANPYGLFDIAGNVMEWCRDWYQQSAEVKRFNNPVGPPGGFEKVLKGGNAKSLGRFLRVGQRFHNPPRFKSGGIRIACEL